MTNYFNHKTISLILIGVGIIALVLLGLRLFGSEDLWLCQDGVWVMHGQPDTPKPSSGCQTGEKVTTVADFEVSAQKPKGTPIGIIINEPKLNAVATSPLMIKGQAQVKHWNNNQLDLKLVDADNQILGQVSASPGETDELGNIRFETKLDFASNTTSSSAGFILINGQFKFPIDLR